MTLWTETARNPSQALFSIAGTRHVVACSALNRYRLFRRRTECHFLCRPNDVAPNTLLPTLGMADSQQAPESHRSVTFFFFFTLLSILRVVPCLLLLQDSKSGQLNCRVGPWRTQRHDFFKQKWHLHSQWKLFRLQRCCAALSVLLSCIVNPWKYI